MAAPLLDSGLPRKTARASINVAELPSTRLNPGSLGMVAAAPSLGPMSRARPFLTGCWAELLTPSAGAAQRLLSLLTLLAPAGHGPRSGCPLSQRDLHTDLPTCIHLCFCTCPQHPCHSCPAVAVLTLWRLGSAHPTSPPLRSLSS